jgi:hypothetical protein
MNKRDRTKIEVVMEVLPFSYSPAFGMMPESLSVKVDGKPARVHFGDTVEEDSVRIAWKPVRGRLRGKIAAYARMHKMEGLWTREHAVAARAKLKARYEAATQLK